MNEPTIDIAGIPVPVVSPFFFVVLGVHVFFGLWCVVTGIVAMWSRKQTGRHPRWGTHYYRGMVVVTATATLLAVMRWQHNYHLLVLAVLASITVWVGRRALRYRWRGWVSWHMSGMGLSYIILLTAFYVDNGPLLPFWQTLPPILLWLLPAAVGLPILLYSLLRHPLQVR